MANFVFLPAIRDFHEGLHNWLADPFKIMLLEAGYVPDKTHEFISSVAAFEAAGAGYTGGFGGSGRQVLAGKSAAIEDPWVTHRASAPSWPSIGVGSVVAAVIVHERTTDADSQLIVYIDSGFPKELTGGTFTLPWHPDGIFRLINVEDIP